MLKIKFVTTLMEYVRLLSGLCLGNSLILLHAVCSFPLPHNMSLCAMPQFAIHATVDERLDNFHSVYTIMHSR